MSKNLSYAIISGLVGAALGFVGGRYLGGVESERPSEGSTAQPSNLPISAPPTRHALRRSRSPAGPKSSPGPAREQRAVEELTDAELRTQLLQARQELALLHEEKHEDQGAPIPFPANLDEKYTKESLIKKMNEAFEKEGVKAEVDVADCDEYPCILCATLGRDEGEPKIDQHLANMRKLAKSGVLSDYEDSERHGTAFSKESREGDKNVNATVVCQALYPKTEDPDEAETIRRRLKHRTSQLEEGF